MKRSRQRSKGSSFTSDDKRLLVLHDTADRIWWEKASVTFTLGDNERSIRPIYQPDNEVLLNISPPEQQVIKLPSWRQILLRPKLSVTNNTRFLCSFVLRLFFLLLTCRETPGSYQFTAFSETFEDAPSKIISLWTEMILIFKKSYLMASVLATRFEKNNLSVLTQRFYQKHDNLETKILNGENGKNTTKKPVKDGRLFFLNSWKMEKRM